MPEGNEKDKPEDIIDILSSLRSCGCDYEYKPNKFYDGKTDLRTHLIVCKKCGRLANYMGF